MIGMALEAGVGDALDRRMRFKKLGYEHRILTLALYSQGEGFDAAQDEP